MSSTIVRVIPALLVVALATNSPLLAQSRSHAAPCGAASRIIGSGAGAAVGAFLGLVGAKIQMSDWSDASRTDGAIARRNRATVGAAVIGAIVGSFGFRDRSCGVVSPILPTAAPQSGWLRPIDADEIQRAGVIGSVYDLVYSLRRNWLYPRGAAPTAPPADETLPAPGEPQLMIYLDEMPLGAVDRLRELPVAGITGVRFFDPAAATYRWGSEYSHGVIQVVTASTDQP